MTDARINTEFPDHFKTQKLVRRLGVLGAWHLLRLWLWATANKPSGSLAGMTDEDIELVAQWPGDAGSLVAALLEVKYLAGRSGGRVLHGWQEHNPWAAGAEMRSSKARWNAVFRHRGRAAANAEVPEWAEYLASLKATSDAKPDASSKGDSNAPIPSYPSQKKEQKKPSPSRGSRLPAGWEPPVELYVWAKREAPGIDHKRELDSFRDYWAAQPGSKGVKLDWDATYRNWIRRSGGQHGTGTGKRGNGRGTSVVEDTAEAVAQRALERKQRGELF